jgi:hypothetical protein
LAAANSHAPVTLRNPISRSLRVKEILALAQPRPKQERRKRRPVRQSNSKLIGKSAGDDADAIGTEHGIQAGGRFEFREKRKPRYRRLKRQRVPRLQQPADEIAVLRARIVSAFYLMRRAAEGQLVQHYAAKLAALSLCVRPEEAAAAANRLRAERDAALEALRAAWRERERDQVRQAVGMLLRSRQATRYRWRSQCRAQVLQTVLFSAAARELVVRKPHNAYRKAGASLFRKRQLTSVDPN